ncbi:MAG: hypothetical protein KJ674_04025 [Nanoarchaeota archaeon]|nr:hypothetical protein [Nanoarchaeota archaeon]
MRIATTYKGLEPILIKETNGKKIIPTKVQYSKNKQLKSALFSYELIKKFKFKTEKEIYEKFQKIKFKIKIPCKIDCLRVGKHKFNSQDIRNNLHKILAKNHKINFKEPKTIIFVDILNNYCFIGINFIKYKRDYRVRASRNSLSPVIAYSLLKIANIKKTNSLLDPFCNDGSILIEAGLLSIKKLCGFTQDTKNALINSKIAKVNIDLSNNQIDWIDTLLKKNSIDFIISKPPILSKRANKELVEKQIRELFYQAQYILKNKLVLITSKTELLEKYSKQFKFSMKKELEIQVGDTLYKVFSFKKTI